MRNSGDAAGESAGQPITWAQKLLMHWLLRSQQSFAVVQRSCGFEHMLPDPLPADVAATRVT